MSEQNIIESVLNQLSFTENEKAKFKEMLQKVQQNKKYGIYSNLRNELKRVIEKDGDDDLEIKENTL